MQATPRMRRAGRASPSPRARAAAFGAVVVTVLVGFVVGASPAGAHAVLVDASPASGEVLEESPPAVELRFDEPVEVGLGAIRLYDAGGRRLDVGSSERDGVVVRSAFGDLDDGSYVVTYRVASADGHPIQGAWVFSVGAPSGSDTEGLADRLLAAQGAPTSVGIAYALVRVLVYLGVVVAIGAAALAVWCWPAGATSRALARLVAAAWLLAVVAGVGGIGIFAAWVAGLGVGDAFDPDLWRDTLETRSGRWWGVRAVLLLAGVPLVVAWWRGLPRRGASMVFGTVLGMGVVVATALSGHAATGDLVGPSVVVDVIHLLGVAAWIGGLVALAAVVLRRPVGQAAPAVTRFSTVAPWLVGVVLATGVARAWVEVGSLAALRDTDYGRLLVVKIVLVGAIIVAASVSREIVQRGVDRRPTDAVGEPLPVGPGADLADSSPAAMRRLRASVGVEVAMAVAVLAVTSVLVAAPPGAEVGDEPFLTVVEGEEILLDVQVVPGEDDFHEVHLQALTPGGTLTDVLDMTATFAEPSREIVGIDVPLRRFAPGHYVSPGAELPFAGDWTLTVVVATGPVTDETFEVVVPIG